MTAEVAVYEPPAALAERDVVDGWVSVLHAYAELAAEICDTDFVPKEMRGSPGTVTACWMAGRELGIGPMTSLKHIQLVRGTPSMSAEYKRARILAAGHELEVLEHDTARCKIRARRRGARVWTELIYTINDAKTAKLVKAEGAWMTRPRRMLFARVTSEMADMLFPDVTMGIPTTEMVESGDWKDGEFAAGEPGAGDMPSAAESTEKPVQRRTARKPRAAAVRAAAPEADAGELEEPAEQDEAGIPDEQQQAEQQQAEHEGAPALAGKTTLRRIDVLFGEIGVASGDVRLEAGRRILGREELLSFSGLSQDEALRVIDVLAAANKKEDKKAALRRLIKAAQEEREIESGTDDQEGNTDS